MSSLIPQPFIDDLLDRIDIVEMIDARVKLKKSGKNYSACCPFHEEKTPSFTVTQDKQFYYCFGCGASGNAIGFLMSYDRLNFPEAVEQLAKQCGLEIPKEERRSSPEQIAKEKDRKSIYNLLEAAGNFYKHQLRIHPSKQKPVSYLQNRGLSGEIARDFGIGYAPPGWDNLLKAIGSDKEDQRLLIESGMLVSPDDSNKIYDRFRDRIIFPIRDVRGRIIGFGGRVLGDDKPKYLNSPESPVFHKGEELYGLYEAREQNSSLKRLLIVEGYMDVVALAQFGIDYAVATLGTACRADHLIKAFKYTQEIVFCFDGDNAGRMAARRALEASLPVMTDGRQVKFLFLPEGEDPDTLIRQIGAEKFTHLIEHALPLEEFFFDVLTEDLDARSLEGRARLSKLAAPQLNQLPSGVYRELMFNQLAKRTGLEKHTLLELIETNPIKPLSPKETTEETSSDAAAITPTNDVEDYFQGQSAADSNTSDSEFEHIGQAIPSEYLHSSEASEGSTSSPINTSKMAVHSEAHIKLPPHKLLALLLFHHPELAQQVTDIEPLKESGKPELNLFIELVELLHQRPQFTTGQIIGYIQGTHGDSGAQPLNELAEQQGKLIKSARQTPSYDPSREFIDSLERLYKQLNKEKAKQTLAQLRQKPFAELTQEEKEQFKEALTQQSQ
ncbi:MAG: DNA primase [Cellvibrionaceae bacterium]